MFHYEYVSKNEAKPYKLKLIDFINEVQNYVRKNFTFDFKFVGSSSRNMITCDYTANIGFDFDVNISVNDREEMFSPKEIRTILHNAFSHIMYTYDYNKCEQSTRVITLKSVNSWNCRINHSCDFMIVHEYQNKQQYIRLNKNNSNPFIVQDNYTWEFQNQSYKELEKRAELLNKNGHWNNVRNKYLFKKNNNNNLNKHSLSIYAETINEIYNYYFY